MNPKVPVPLPSAEVTPSVLFCLLPEASVHSHPSTDMYTEREFSCVSFQ